MREPSLRRASGLRTTLALGVVAALVLLLAAIWAGRRDGPPSDDRGDVVRVGVVQGQSVPVYLASARTELAALTEPADTWALVSLDGYFPPGRLPGLLEGVAVAQVFARVPLSGAPTPVERIATAQLRDARLPAEVMSGMLDAALRRDQEQAGYLQLGRRLPAEQERARRAYETAAVTAAAEAAAYRTGCSCVFAAVVHAVPGALREVADRPGVRVVDPAPEVRRLDRTEFRPPLPEQIGTVPAEPSRSPAVPNDGSGIASSRAAPIMSSLGVDVTSASPGGSVRATDPSAAALEERVVIASASNPIAAQDGPGGSPAAP